MPFAQEVILALVSRLRKQILLSSQDFVPFYCNVKLFVFTQEPDIFLQRTLIKKGIVLIINDFCSRAYCFLCMTLSDTSTLHLVMLLEQCCLKVS